MEGNFSWFADKVLEGEADSMLLLPLWAPIACGFRYVSVPEFAQVVSGVILLVVGVAVGDGIDEVNLIFYFLLLLLGAITMFSSRAIAAGIAFYLPRFEPSVLYRTFWQVGQFPSRVYPRWIVVAGYAVIPAFATSDLPFRALFTPSLALICFGLAITGLQVGVMTLTWRLGLRRYESAAS